ncbi:hypothetical protein P8452_66413 [Trifolium repens]|nr:hypothetical protein P8452_66413 [Trifolium repens]
MEEVEETTFVVVSLVTMLLGVMSWYYDKYFVKEPARNWELERRIFLNRLYRGTEADCIEQLRMFVFVFKSHEEAKRFRFKVIPNWDDIVDICAKDRASGVQVEHPFEADDVMDKEANAVEEGSSVFIDLEEASSTTKKKNIQCSRANKGKDKDGIINFMREVAGSLKDFVEVSKRRIGGNDQVVQEVLNEVEMIDDIDEAQSYKAINWLVENPNKVAVLKALPLTKKKKYLLASMS